MSRLIDADALQIAFIEVGQANKRYKLGEFWELNGAEIKETIGAAPTIDAEPVRNGRWVLVNDNNGQHCACEFCGEWKYHQKQKFCGECGCRMTEVEHE